MTKRKILVLALTVAMAAILVAGGTLAYLTGYEDAVNTFTAGRVGIELDEAQVKEDLTTGDLVEDTNKDRVQENKYDLHPNMNVFKDPTITVKADSEDTYIGAIITITGDLYDLMPLVIADNESFDNCINIHRIASGGLLEEDCTIGEYGTAKLAVFENSNFAIYQKPGDDNLYGEKDDRTENTWTLYLFMKNPYEKKTTDQEIVLFEQLTIPPEYDNEQMAKLNGMEIKVEAFAVQADGFVDMDADGNVVSDIGCYDAMTTAFDEQWPFATAFKDVTERNAN